MGTRRMIDAGLAVCVGVTLASPAARAEPPPTEARQAIVRAAPELGPCRRRPLPPPAVDPAREPAAPADAREQALRDAALALHARAQEMKTTVQLGESAAQPDAVKPAYARAAAAYERYLAAYPHAASAHEVRFYRAEALYYSDQLARAAAAYERVAADPFDARYREEAAWSAVKAREALLRGAVAAGTLPPEADPTRPNDPVASRRAAARPLPSLVSDWLRAVDFYVLGDLSRSSDRSEQAALARAAAELLTRWGHRKRARGYLSQLIACLPDHPDVPAAFALIIDGLAVEQDWAGIARWARLYEQVAPPPPGAPGPRGPQPAPVWRAAEQLFEARRYLEAAREFERLADAHPDVPYLDKAYFNAGIAFGSARHHHSAARVFERLADAPRFVESALRAEILLQLARSRHASFDFVGAARAYERYASTFPNHTDALPARLTAADLHRDLGDARAARRGYRAVLRRASGRPTLAATARRGLALLRGERPTPAPPRTTPTRQRPTFAPRY